MGIFNKSKYHNHLDNNDSYISIFKSIYDFENEFQDDLGKKTFLSEMEKIITTFFKKDNLSPQKLYDNLITNNIVTKHSSLDYYLMINRHSAYETKMLNPTKSFKAFFCDNIYDRPRGFPEWFIIGYPDVALWINKNVKNPQPGFPNINAFVSPEGELTLDFFMQCIDIYKRDYKLECV
jgi:hypothetical protein